MIQRAFAFALGTALAFASQVFAAESSAPRAKTSLIWLFGDDDLLRPASSTLPISHGLGFGDRSGYGAFFDSLGARDRGRESALVLHRSEHAEGLVRGLDTFAELNLSLLLGANAAALELEDRGTRLGIRWSAPALARAFELGLFPFDSDSVRLGALRELSFGGTDFRHADSSFPFAAPGIPALRARFEARAFSGFLAAKWGEGTGPAAGQSLPALLGSVSWQGASSVQLSLGAGAIRYPSLEIYGGPKRASFGAVGQARLELSQGLNQLSVPGSFATWLRRSREPADSTGWAVALETSVLAQRLADFDQPGAVRLARAAAGAMSLELAGAGIDSSLAFWVRELGYVVRDGPGLFPGQALPRAGTAEPELSVAISSVCTRLGAWTPEFSAGLRLPATFTPQAGSAHAQPIVVRGPGDFAPLVAGSRRVPLLEARLALSVRVSSLLVFAGFISYRRDNNRTALVRDANEVLLRTFVAPDFLGAGLLARVELAGP